MKKGRTSKQLLKKLRAKSAFLFRVLGLWFAAVKGKSAYIHNNTICNWFRGI